MTYITGDSHGNFVRIDTFCCRLETQKTDTIVILGDAGFNYYRSKKDAAAKQFASKFPINLLCIHGNHEIRPQNLLTYKEATYHGGKVLYEEEFPNIFFAIDGEVYDLDDFKCLVIGGAYSVDKFYRLERGFGWWPDEQPSDEIKAAVEAKLVVLDNKIDIVLSHTCPLRYEPSEVFLKFIPQDTVDKSNENGLIKLKSSLTIGNGIADTTTRERKSTRYNSCSKTLMFFL